MTTLELSTQNIETFDNQDFLNERHKDLQAVAREFRAAYAAAEPFPSMAFQDFFNPDILDAVLAEFTDLGNNGDLHYNTPNELKLASVGERRFGPVTKAFARFLNSEPFLLFLQELTGIEETLLPDPYFEGAAFHQIKPGGFLKIHADFNKNRRTGLDRRLNVLVYLNKDWDDSYGGHLELWNLEMTRCVKKIPPVFNTLGMFTTTSHSWHGLPNPLTCPPGRSRQSLALYYYTNGRPVHEIEGGLEEHTTIFKDRKGDRVDEKMRQFNAGHVLKEFVKDLTPPLVFRAAKWLTGN